MIKTEFKEVNIFFYFLNNLKINKYFNLIHFFQTTVITIAHRINTVI